tara:strand:- start:322 stop:651 length:330 start_codon:yes stop_codon:yes gene_type:complete
MKTIQIHNINCLVGQNKNDNWKLLDNIKNKEYYFFHLSSFSSAYVFAETDFLTDNKIIKDIAKVCLNNTKYKNLKNIKVDYCRVKNLEKGENIGEVIYISNRKVKQIKI